MDLSGWRESLALTLKVATMLADSRADADTIVTALIADLFSDDAAKEESGGRSDGTIIGRGGGGDGAEMEGPLRDRLEFVRSNFGTGVAELTAHRLYLGSVTDPLGAARALQFHSPKLKLQRQCSQTEPFPTREFAYLD